MHDRVMASEESLVFFWMTLYKTTGPFYRRKPTFSRHCAQSRIGRNRFSRGKLQPTGVVDQRVRSDPVRFVRYDVNVRQIPRRVHSRSVRRGIRRSGGAVRLFNRRAMFVADDRATLRNPAPRRPPRQPLSDGVSGGGARGHRPHDVFPPASFRAPPAILVQNVPGRLPLVAVGAPLRLHS